MILPNGMTFENDEAAVGKWSFFGWKDDPAYRSAGGLLKDSEAIPELFFLPQGQPYWIFEGWTKGYLLIHHGGDDPIETYPYEISTVDGKTFLFLFQTDRTDVFLKMDGKQYSKSELGRHDRTDYPFIDDAAVKGSWRSVGFVENAEDCLPGNGETENFLRSMEFCENGELILTYMDEIWRQKWTQGLVINLRLSTSAPYFIKEIDGDEYLFMEWRTGNYVYGNCKPDYYVFKREKKA